MGLETVAPSIFQRLATAVRSDAKKQTPRSDAPMPNLESNSHGDIFIQLSLELFQNSKEYRKEQFKLAVNKALGNQFLITRITKGPKV